MIGILLISTGKYSQFVQKLVTQIDQYFLPEKRIFLFTDTQLNLTTTSEVVQMPIWNYKYPFVTLLRYEFFDNHRDKLSRCSHLLYLDVDMSIEGNIGNEFLTLNEGLIVVRHPGYYTNNGWGDNDNPVNSRSYLPKEMRKHYYCGGVQGGITEDFLHASMVMAKAIREDEKLGVIPEWNDETFWNWYIHTSGVKVNEFTPSYCIPEQIELRKAWGLENLPVKIIALAKNHEQIRQ